jgi:hypothetical protein
MNARITDRQDLKVAHEPSHRLVKVRTVVLERQLGRVHTAALVAFERVKTLCVKIAESHQPFVGEAKKGEVAGPAATKQSNPEPTPEDTTTESGDSLPPDHAPDVSNDTAVNARGGVASSKGPRDKGPQDGNQPQDGDSLSCDKCRGRLSFPCWYCIYCEGQFRKLIWSPHVLRPSTTLSDDLFLCEACDRKGDLELMRGSGKRGSGKHTEDHHLIRCLAPEKDDDALSLEDQLKEMRSQFDNMESRFGDLIRDFTTRIGNMEQLLHKLAILVASTKTVV